MDLEKIDGIKVFIIESLHENDKRTGENLKDNLRQIWYDQGLLSYFLTSSSCHPKIFVT